DRAATGDRQPVRIVFDRGAETGQQFAEMVARLVRGVWPSADVDTPACDEWCDRERCGRGEVGLDGEFPAVQGRGGYSELCPVAAGPRAEVAQSLQCHRDVRFARWSVADKADRDAVATSGTDQQQSGQELAGGGGIQLHSAAGQTAGAVDGEGKPG